MKSLSNDLLPKNALTLHTNKTQNPYQQLVADIFRLIKFHNSSSLLNVTPEDVVMLAADLEKETELDVVKEAFNEIKNIHANQYLTLGKFIARCHELQKVKNSFMAITPGLKIHRRTKASEEAMKNIREVLARAGYVSKKQVIHPTNKQELSI